MTDGVLRDQPERLVFLFPCEGAHLLTTQRVVVLPAADVRSPRGLYGSCGSLDGRETKPHYPRAVISRPYGFRRSPSETMSYRGWAAERRRNEDNNKHNWRNVHSDLSF